MTIKHNSRGFSLIELMVVVVIIGIVIAIAVPGFNAMQRKARLNGVTQEFAQEMRSTRERAIATNGEYRISFPNQYEYITTRPNGQVHTKKVSGTIGGNLQMGNMGVGLAPGGGEANGNPPANGADFPGGIIIFETHGGVNPKGVAYFTDGRELYAVCINSLGKIRVVRYVNGAWSN